MKLCIDSVWINLIAATLLYSCMFSGNRETVKVPEPGTSSLPQKEKKSDSGMLFGLFGSDKSEKKSDSKPAPEEHLPFRHISWLSGAVPPPVMESAKPGNLKGILIRSRVALRGTGLSPDDPDLKNSDPSGEDLLFVGQKNRGFAETVEISGLSRAGDKLKVYVQVYSRSPTCPGESVSSTALNVSGHLIAVEKNLPGKIPELVITRSRSLCELPPSPGAELRKVSYSTLHSSSKARYHEDHISLTALTSIWGEWGVFLRRHCTDCLTEPKLPPGFPDEAFVVGVVDYLDPHYGYSGLEPSGMYTDESGLFLKLKRIIRLCPKPEKKGAPLLILAFKKSDFPKNFKPEIKNIHLLKQGIPTEQKVCPEEEL